MAGIRIPRWTVAGEPVEIGVAVCQVELPDELTSALQKLAGDCGVPLRTLLRTAHTKVLVELSSERALLSGHSTWRELIASGLALTAEDDELTLADGDHIRLTYHRAALNAEHAERVAGYHLAALRLMVSDVDAEHGTQSLLGPDELTFQRKDLSGPRIPLDDELFVEAFEDQVHLRPDTVAAVHNGERWTYAELNTKANQIAHLLLRRGLQEENVVAVCMPRNLNWLAAMLGIFKAGGCYFPVRPDFPPDRVADQVSRSDCRFALTERGSENPLSTSDDCNVMYAADAYTSVDVENPETKIRPDQLAYIYFTSGSTGAPKGAMCEHAGMFNHLLMKVEDMRLRYDDGVTQTASQCFDISLWQLASPLIVGGHTVIVDTDVQLDVAKFIDVISEKIQVIQIVPSYLDVMLTHLERNPRSLGSLRSISVTGEALKRELVRRWFALYPEITLVNAYGATEVSDDTMHAVLHELPVRDLAIMPVGTTLRNVNTYILNENLQIVPLGAPGEIAFSGVCVGRGYINDPERTAAAFVEDPYLTGTRLYRTGDFGRWIPERTIEFLGRRDEQVKIRGFRIEIGEIESKLLRMPGVREAAVVINGDSDGKKLVAFFSGTELQPADLRDWLSASVPEYMVPSYFHRLDDLPLTDNGKVNKKLLTAMAAELSQETAEYVPPVTAAERKLATAWAEILGVLVGQIGRDDDFFKLGGTSLAAVRLVVKLDRAISLRQLVATPVLKELAALIDGSASAQQGLLQRLSTSDNEAKATVVCFPYAGGNAVNFQQVGQQLAGKGFDVYATELPGHDVARTDEQLAGVADIAQRTVQELGAINGPLVLWGHCAGAAYAVEVARLMEQAGRPAARVFIGALMLDGADVLREENRQVSALSTYEITAQLHQDSAYVELDLLKAERSELVGLAYRHDVVSTNDYLIGASHRLATPVEVVVAADDSTTVEYHSRHRGWERLASSVTLHELDEGGHYFVRTRATEVAELVARSLA